LEAGCVVYEVGDRPLRSSINKRFNIMRTLFNRLTGFTFMIWLAPVTSAFTQHYDIDWWTVDGGGATSSGGVYSVSGTIGQPDAVLMSGGNFTLAGGFWSIVISGFTPEIPSIGIACMPSAVRLSWSPSATGFVLEQAPHLTTPIPWTQLLTPYLTNVDEVYVLLPIVGESKFYRLRKP
jgi:hypothetical protein